MKLFGDFNADDELTFCSAPDLEKAWCRFQDETPERFSRRVANDILEARGLPPLPGRSDLAKPIPAAPPAHYHKDEVGRRGPRKPTLARAKALAG